MENKKEAETKDALYLCTGCRDILPKEVEHEADWDEMLEKGEMEYSSDRDLEGEFCDYCACHRKMIFMGYATSQEFNAIIEAHHNIEKA